MTLSNHPYKELSDKFFFRKLRRELQANSSSLISPFKKIGIETPVAIMSFGSCFAENIIPYLAFYGIRYVRTEKTLEFYSHLPGKDNVGYSIFSCEYGNIYTPKHALQLFGNISEGIERERSSGFQFDDSKNIIDLMRPAYPVRASSIDQYINRRLSHRKACHQAVKDSTHAVITLGLAEGWESISSGLAVPSCPGVIVGEYDKDFHIVDYSLESLRNDLYSLVASLRNLNNAMELIFTVSPIPMIASALEGATSNVLVANSVAKAKLILAATELAAELDWVSYYPSYELITTGILSTQSFEEDARTVKRNVLDSVFSHMLSSLPGCSLNGPSIPTSDSTFTKGQILAHRLSVLECEEARYDQ